MDEIRFFIERRGKVTGPVTDDDVRDALRAGKLGEGTRVRLAGTELWASPRAFVALGRSPGAGRSTLPPAPAAVARELPEALAAAPSSLRDVLLFWVAEGELVFGPLSGEQIRHSLEAGQHREAAILLVDEGAWIRAALLGGSRDSAVAAAEYAREPSLVGPERAAPPTPKPAALAPISTASGQSRDATPPPTRRQPQRAIYLGAAGPAPASRATSPSSPTGTVRCPVCLERITAGLATCPECGETTAAPPSTSGSPSIPDELPGQSALSLHWRPIVTMGAIVTLVCTGIALRHLAPGRFLGAPRAAARAATATQPAATCATSCWAGESCESGHCVWHAPNEVTHIGRPGRPAHDGTAGSAPHESAPTEPREPARAPEAPSIAGPFALPRDVTDALPLDSERFAVALLTGLQIHNARTGGVLGLVTDAPQSRRLYRVGPVVYATAPQRIFVVDAETTRLLKTVEIGAAVGEITLGASGRRALASLPSAHAVAVLATEYHAEIDRIQFGDDLVGPLGADDTGKRALTTTGQVPLPGLQAPQGGAVYAFDPSRLASAQDRVRASVVGNPVSVLMTPDGEHSYVVLRAEDALVPLEWQPSGAVRQESRIPTCHEPEQIELVRRGRLGIVRCNEGRAIEVFDLQKRELVRHVPFNARVADLAVSPDGKQAIVALPADGAGFVGLVDLETWAVKVLPLNAEPTRVRLSPDGSMALVLSDRAKVAWVIR